MTEYYQVWDSLTAWQEYLRHLLGLDLIASFMLDLVKERKVELEELLRQYGNQLVDNLGQKLFEHKVCGGAEARNVIVPALIVREMNIGDPPEGYPAHLPDPAGSSSQHPPEEHDFWNPSKDYFLEVIARKYKTREKKYKSRLSSF